MNKTPSKARNQISNVFDVVAKTDERNPIHQGKSRALQVYGSQKRGATMDTLLMTDLATEISEYIMKWFHGQMTGKTCVEKVASALVIAGSFCWSGFWLSNRKCCWTTGKDSRSNCRCCHRR